MASEIYTETDRRWRRPKQFNSPEMNQYLRECLHTNKVEMKSIKNWRMRRYLPQMVTCWAVTVSLLVFLLQI